MLFLQLIHYLLAQIYIQAVSLRHMTVPWVRYNSVPGSQQFWGQH